MNGSMMFQATATSQNSVSYFSALWAIMGLLHIEPLIQHVDIKSMIFYEKKKLHYKTL